MKAAELVKTLEENPDLDITVGIDHEAFLVATSFEVDEREDDNGNRIQTIIIHASSDDDDESEEEEELTDVAETTSAQASNGVPDSAE